MWSQIRWRALAFLEERQQQSHLHYPDVFSGYTAIMPLLF